MSNNFEIIEPDTFDLYEDSLESDLELSYIEEETVIAVAKMVSPDVVTVTEYNIVNYTDTTKVLDNGFGTIAYNIPNKFRVNE